MNQEELEDAHNHACLNDASYWQHSQISIRYTIEVLKEIKAKGDASFWVSQKIDELKKKL